jgi:hypothetical protein
LEKLIVKWRKCAQKTAERVFVAARNRIDGMGGFKKFMENQRRRPWDDESQSQRDTESQDTGEAEAVEEEEHPEEFTMEIMLKMAGVEERLIGWSRELNNFVKS